MTEVCRTCLVEIDDGSVTFCLNSVEFDMKPTTVGNKLAYCIPEMDMDVVPNAVICSTCHESMTLAHEFKTKCLKTEGRIQSYIEQTGYMLARIDLRDVAQQQQNCDDDTSLDMKFLQCDAKDFFDVPKIAQLLADGTGSSERIDRDDCVHKCNKCDYRAAKRQTLIVHMRKHSKDQTRRKLPKPYECVLCEYSSSRKSNLRYHMEAHLSGRHKTNAKIYRCAFCEYSSTRSKSLAVHLRVHLKNKIYTCTFCQYGSSSKFTFLRHLAVHNADKILHCLHCGFETIGKSDLQTHMRLHSYDFTSFAETRIDDNNVAVNNVT